jgi:hypothetical protein
MAGALTSKPMARLSAWWARTAHVRARMRLAAPSTLMVHAVQSLCTAGFVVPLAASVPEQALAEQPAVGALFTAIRMLDNLTGSPLRYGAVPALALLVVTPFLQVVWLRAQLTAAPLPEHARVAASVYKQACLNYLAGINYSALLVSLAWLVARAAELALGWTHNLRIQQTCGLLLAAPCGLAALLHAPSVLDKAQLALARGEPVHPLTVLRSVDLRVCAMRAGFSAGAVLLVLLTLLPRLWLGTNGTSALVLFVLAQLTAAARTLARAAWLAWLAGLAEPEPQPASLLDLDLNA